MPKTFFALLLAFAYSHPAAGRETLRPHEFHPLSELPWMAQGARLETVLASLFLEPNIHVRTALLTEYLRIIPVTDLERAFDLCVVAHGSQTPNELVQLLLEIWADRDGKACWEKTRSLFHLVGPEEGWLGYEGWRGFPKMKIQDRAAVRASSFWIQPYALGSFPLSLERSRLPREQRITILKEFSHRWLEAFGRWPDFAPPEPGLFPRDLVKLIERRHTPWKFDSVNYKSPGWDVEHEIILRQLIADEPEKAAEWIEIADQKARSHPEHAPPRWSFPSPEHLIIWANRDLPGLKRWANSLTFGDETDRAISVRGFLLGKVDLQTRERWFTELASDNRDAAPEESREAELYAEWARWEPDAALEAALKANPEFIPAVAECAASGPWPGTVNTRRHGVEAVRRFDLSKLPARMSDRMAECYSDLTELLADEDIGMAAQFGYKALQHLDKVPRERLIAFFSGKEDGLSEDGIIDRTFCALRTWAACKPDEMKAWIATLTDPEMQKALIWLLENPWGSAEDVK